MDGRKLYFHAQFRRVFGARYVEFDGPTTATAYTVTLTVPGGPKVGPVDFWPGKATAALAPFRGENIAETAPDTAIEVWLMLSGIAGKWGRR